MNFLKILLIITCCYFIACKKNNGSENPGPVVPPTGKKVAVKFQVADFTQEFSGSRNAKVTEFNQDSLRNYITYLYYLAYDSTGKQVSTIIQGKDLIYFGKITDSLLPGKYTIIVLGSNNFLRINDWYYDPSNPTAPIKWDPLPLSAALIRYGPQLGGTGSGANIVETFYKKVNVTVNGDSTITDISLNRIVGKCEVIAEDSSDFDVIRAKIVVETNYYSMGPDTISYLIDYSRNGLLDSDMMFENPSPKRPTRFIMNNISPFTVTIYGGTTTQMGISKKVNGVRCYWNKRTILKGRIGTSPGGRSEVNVSRVTERDGEIIIEF